MPVTARPLLPFAEPTYVSDLEGLYEPWAAASAPAPEMLVLNDALAAELGADPDALHCRDGVALLLGTGVPDRLPTVAQGYAGHQFGSWSPRLGDGRGMHIAQAPDGHLDPLPAILRQPLKLICRAEHDRKRADVDYGIPEALARDRSRRS